MLPLKDYGMTQALSCGRNLALTLMIPKDVTGPDVLVTSP